MNRAGAFHSAVDMWLEERMALHQGFRCVAGIDEAGRGALAGPVVAACVVLPLECDSSAILDSKMLTPVQRERSFERIVACARGIGVGTVGSGEIDTINILRATHAAMRLAVRALPAGLQPDLTLIDGLPVQPFPVEHVAIVGGDSKSVSIAAASIIAKVTRDRLMVEFHSSYPAYGFAVHKGYGTPEHLAALSAQGPCPIHRRSFRPVAIESTLNL